MNSNPQHPKIEAAQSSSHRNSMRLIVMAIFLAYGFSITTYYAHAWGKSVIANIYPGGPNGQFGSVETNFHF